MRSTVAALALPLLVLAGCGGGDTETTPAPASTAAAAPTTTASAPATGEFGAPIVTEEPSASGVAPPPAEWVVNRDLAGADAGMIDILRETRGASSASLETGRDIAYYVCSWLRYDPTESALDVVQKVYVSTEALDAARIGNAAQGYCLDTVE